MRAISSLVVATLSSLVCLTQALPTPQAGGPWNLTIGHRAESNTTTSPTTRIVGNNNTASTTNDGIFAEKFEEVDPSPVDCNLPLSPRKTVRANNQVFLQQEYLWPKVDDDGDLYPMISYTTLMFPVVEGKRYLLAVASNHSIHDITAFMQLAPPANQIVEKQFVPGINGFPSSNTSGNAYVHFDAMYNGEAYWRVDYWPNDEVIEDGWILVQLEPHQAKVAGLMTAFEEDIPPFLADESCPDTTRIDMNWPPSRVPTVPGSSSPSMED